MKIEKILILIGLSLCLKSSDPNWKQNTKEWLAHLNYTAAQQKINYNFNSSFNRFLKERSLEETYQLHPFDESISQEDKKYILTKTKEKFKFPRFSSSYKIPLKITGNIFLAPEGHLLVTLKKERYDDDRTSL